MIKKITLTLVAAAITTSLYAKDAALNFPASGFSIAQMDVPSDNIPVQTLTMCLPAKSGFAANVNVQVQPYDGSIDDYLTLSTGQFKQFKMQLIKTEKVNDDLIMEYSGEMQGRTLHFYSRSKKQGKKIYLATATSLESDWADQSAKLKLCVDSLKTNMPKGS